MSVSRLSALIVLLTLFTGSSSALSALAEAGDHVITTDRLNLRACPGTEGCAVLRTLPRDTHLGVNERQGDWLHVTSVEPDETGWVHAGYTQVVEGSSSRDWFTSNLMLRDPWMKLYVLLCILGALWIMASFGRGILEGATRGHLFALSALSVLAGAFFLLNQFGPILAELARPWLNLQNASFFWEINSVAEDVSYWKVALFLGSVTIGVAAIAPGTNGSKLSFLQGACTGFLTLPLLTIVATLLALIGYLLSFVVKALAYILGLIAIPFIWLFEHIIAPVLRWLAIPFAWLWEHLLRDIILFLAPPFVWLWQVLLQPLLALLSKFIMKPILFLITGIVAALVFLFPFGAIGIVALESVRSAVRGPLNSEGLFAQGVTTGFLLLDTVVLASLNGLGILHTAPPLSLILPVTLQLIVFLRLLVSRERTAVAEAKPAFQQKLAIYWRSSRLELISTCVMIPLGLFAALAAGQDS